MTDYYDGLVTLGVILIAAAAGMVAGWPATLLVIGITLVVVGVLGATRSE